MADVFLGIASTVVTEFVEEGLTLTDVTPVVEDEGGCEIYITGIFQNAQATVEIVIDENTSVICYAGTYGQGNLPLPLSPGVLRASTYPLPIGGPYDVKVTQGESSATLFGALTVVARNWRAKVFNFRRVFPPWMRVGAKRLDTVGLLLSTLDTAYVSDQLPFVGVPYSYTVAAFNPTAGTLVWSSVGVALPGWLSLDANTGTLSGTPAPGDEGTLAGVQLEVTDGSSIVQTNVFDIITGVVALSVAEVPDPLGAVQSVAFSYIPDIDNTSGFPLTVTSIGTALPGWASLSPTTGEISGTPAAPDVGTTVGVQLEITDGFSTVQTNIFDLEVT